MDGHEHNHTPEHQHHEGHYGHAGGKKVPAVAVFAIVGLVCLIVGYLAHGALGPAACQANNSTDVCTAPTSTPSGSGLTSAQLTALKADMGTYLTTVIAINGAPDGVAVQVKNITREGDMYKAFYDIVQDGSVAQSGSGYVTSDGKRLFLGTYMDLTEKLEKPTPKPPVEVNVTGRPFQGSANATVTIVEFSDFQCPYCKVAYANLETVLKTYNGSVKYYLVHFPLSMHATAQKASEAFECAMLQGEAKGWQMYDVMFTKGSGDGTGLAVADLKAYAKNLSLDTAKFDKCLDEGQTAAKVNADAEYGASVGVTGTPTFYVNGKEAVGGSAMQSAVEAILKK